MAGGDLDGDVYFATWNPNFICVNDKAPISITK